MRILTFLHSFEPGGVERVALRLVRAWRAEGVDAPLFMGRADGAMREEMAADLAYDTPRQPFATGWIETAWMIVMLPRAIIRLRPDALFCAGNSYTIVALAMKLLLGRRCPPILAKVSNDLERRDMIAPVRWLYRRWLRLHGHFIDHFIGMEVPMADEIAAAIPAALRRLSIIADPALDEAQVMRLHYAVRSACETRNRGISFVAIGRLATQKNVALMLRAFALGAAALDRLTIYGDGPQRAMLTSLCRDLEIEDRVTWAGHVPDPASRLADFDIFLLSSDYEGVPAVIVEALAAGLPIIATRCSVSMATLTGHGALAKLVDVGDLEGFSAAIRNAGAVRQDRAVSLAQARRFTVERASRAYLACFHSLQRHRTARRKNFAPLDCGGSPHAPSEHPKQQ
ncbi:glycosyltransferase [Sphingobium sp. CAP-1]|uniref:glycosyltransferase n=1 Tax=Sphingobium sp. CAP-1 TaxID=2676077 RepID=UPI0012BB3831|nr:glycosyltransferase [Sphingobium sp. CAP-1]QGP78453.1 glycosyltransferase [Sphingobium sp. CAP-1]